MTTQADRLIEEANNLETTARDLRMQAAAAMKDEEPGTELGRHYIWVHFPDTSAGRGDYIAGCQTGYPTRHQAVQALRHEAGPRFASRDFRSGAKLSRDDRLEYSCIDIGRLYDCELRLIDAHDLKDFDGRPGVVEIDRPNDRDPLNRHPVYVPFSDE